MLRPVNRLPPEILSCIARGVRDNFDEVYSDKHTKAVIPLTHVCRYWRESIVSIPENWTVISDSRKKLMVLSLERAKAALLEIHLNIENMQNDPQLLNLLTPHFQNTETLVVTGLEATKDLSLFSRHPMINLRSLSLSESEYAVALWDRSIDPFESSVYALRYLKLFEVPLHHSFLNIKTLTRLEFCDSECNLHLDTLLDFLEENRSLTSVELGIQFVEPSLRSSRRRAPIGNQLQCLRITCYNAIDSQALISSIVLSKGAKLEFTCQRGYRVEIIDVLSNISTTHLSNLPSPTFMRYRVRSRAIELCGPNGAASFVTYYCVDNPFIEFPRLPLASIRQLHLNAREWEPIGDPVAFHHLSSFPALKTFIIECKTDLSHFLSALLSNPPASPSLNTLAFMDCVLTEEFMKQLTQFAFDRKNTTSARLHRVVITHRDGILPSMASIRYLEEHVPIVEVRTAANLSTDL